MNAVAKRTVTALATAAGVVALFLWCPLSALAPILIVLSALVQLEFYQLVRAYEPNARLGLLLGFLWLSATAAFPGLSGLKFCCAYGGLLAAPVLFLFAVGVLFRKSCTRPVATLASTLFGFFYVPFLVSFFLRVVQLEAMDVKMFEMPDTRVGLYTLFFLLAATKLSDMGGFAFGLAFGRHKMCPSVSPKKSWEGFAGSVLGSVLVSVAFCHAAQRFGWAEVCPFWRHVSLSTAVALGAAIATCGTLGDLVESRIKRECGAKDSATFMPAGMGGFLDMFDSILFVPALFYPFIMLAR